MYKNLILLIFSLWIGLLGCSANGGIPKNKLNSAQTQQKSEGKTQEDREPLFKTKQAKQARGLGKNIPGVDDVTAVVMDKEVFLAAKVTNFHRLRMRTIRKEVHQKLKTQFKEYKIHVTTDNKLFKEIESVENEVESNQPNDPQKMKKKMKKIHDDMT